MKIAKVFLEFAKLAGIDIRWCVVDGKGELRFFVFLLGFEDLTGAGDGVTLTVEEALDAEGHLDVAAAIETLACAAFMGFELRKLALPETQDIGWDIAELSDFTDAEVELVRDVGSGCGAGLTDWLVLRHARKLRCRYAVGGGLQFGLCQYRPPNPMWSGIFVGEKVTGTAANFWLY